MKTAKHSSCPKRNKRICLEPNMNDQCAETHTEVTSKVMVLSSMEEITRTFTHTE